MKRIPPPPSRTRLATLLILPLLLTLGVITAPAASAADAGGAVTIGGKCLDDADFGTANGTAIQVYTCNGSAAQSWTWRTDGTVAVTPATGTTKCLDVTGGSHATGALIQLYDCVANAAQKFKALPDGTIYSVQSGKCLGVVGGSIVNNARVGLAPCDPAQATQRWTAATAPKSAYTVSSGAAVPFNNADDTPSFPYIDANGQFYYQSAHALYGVNDKRKWSFFTGANFDNVTTAAITSATDNADTTTRCNTSPTGVNATPSSGYPLPNYCDLTGVWVDPDTGWWYGLVHNEFTGQPFGDGLHFDAIDYAVSKDKGNTWAIPGHAITSPYSTTRGDTAAFPQSTYYYGDGDPRLFVDYASGYFYVFYATRAVGKTGGAVWLQHVARAPIAQKMASSSWTKWYDGAWQTPGVGGAESNIIPAEGLGSGYTPPNKDYSPTATGTVAAQVAAGTMPDSSQLAVMNVAWNAYLGLYIGTPQNNVAQNTGVNTPLHFYATRDLATQQWFDLGLTNGNLNGAWYRWFLDSGNLTSSTVVGKTFRSYCVVACSTYGAEYTPITLQPTSASALPTAPVAAGTGYQILASTNRYLVQNGTALTTSGSSSTSASQQWMFNATGDGFFTVTNAASGQALGVDSSTNAGRAWAAPTTMTTLASSGPTTGQQWYLQTVVRSPATSGASTATGTYRLVNRYSGLALSLTSSAPGAVTAPQRNWDNAGTAGDTRPAAAQTLSFSAAGGSTGTDLALNRPTTASSVEPGTTFTANLATDGNANTRWSSGYSDIQWLQVDLGTSRTITEVKLSWEAAYAKAFQIQTSTNGTSWSTIYSTTAGTGGVQDLTGLTGSGRYLRIYTTARGTGYGYSLRSLQAYGS
ncbi:RICIN domain-containing protein [Micromonospora orduensis]|uniref:RICIN domain-containing protein n=1 Tax=Micromonospora orduensis TaxID=1420891 RepID=UPI0033C5EA71